MRRRRRGFSLIEVVVALAMVAVMAATLGMTIRQQIWRAKANRAVQEVLTLEQGVGNWMHQTLAPDFSGLTLAGMVAAKAVPDGLGSATAGPYGAGYDVGPDPGDARRFVIRVKGVNGDVIGTQALQNAFADKATVSVGATDITITFN
jgi:prepilin-type N-terminal cleavage/methylation domain-containing protein